MKIYCNQCQKEIEVRLTSGEEIYPHRPDLYDLPFWKCDVCKNFVGCHHKTDNPTKPLGTIATEEVRKAKRAIHALLDPLWQNKKIKRGQAYAYIKHRIGYDFHTGEINDIEEARKVYKIVATLHNELSNKGKLF